MIKYLKNLLTSFLIWLKPPKIGSIQIDVPETGINQNIKVEENTLDVELEEWADTFTAVFESDNFVAGGIVQPDRPSDEVLKRQVQSFYKDYRKLNQKVDEVYTKTLKYEE